MPLRVPSLAIAVLVIARVVAHAETAAPALPALDIKIAAPTLNRDDDKFVPFFQPFETERASISPDGKYLAYSLREGETLSVVVVEIDHPDKATAKVVVAMDSSSTATLAANQYEKTPAKINWMRWTTPTRVVVETNTVMTIGGPAITPTDDTIQPLEPEDSSWATRPGVVLGFDADGGNAHVLAKPGDFTESRMKLPALRAARPFSKDDFMLRAPTLASERSAKSDNSGLPGRELGADSPLRTGINPESPFSEDGASIGELTFVKSVHVRDLVPNQPGKVYLVTVTEDETSRQYCYHELDTVTGKIELQVQREQLSPGFAALLDRQGLARITLPDSTRISFPHRFEYTPVSAFGRPHNLSQVHPLPDAPFEIRPDNFFGRRSIPLGFGYDPNLLYFASNSGRDSFGIYSADLNTGKIGDRLKLENPHYDLVPPLYATEGESSLVFDRFDQKLAGVRFDATLRTTAWLRPEFNEVQKFLEAALPGNTVEIQEWDAAHNRFVVLANGPANAGGFYVFDVAKHRLSQFARRAPWIDAGHTHATLAFTYPDGPAGPVSGLITIPNQPRRKPAPLILLCPTLPFERVRSEYQSRVQALADMGFAVAQINGRGVWGHGLKRREAITAGYDDVQVADLVDAAEHMQKMFAIDPKRIALMGDTHGGFIALRAVQQRPDLFRCAIAVNAPVELQGWLNERHWSDNDPASAFEKASLGDDAHLKARPLVSKPETITRPVLLLQYGGLDGDLRNPAYLAAKNFASDVRRHGHVAEFENLPTDYMKGLPQARSAVYSRIWDFINEYIYDYKVYLGDLKVKDNPPAPKH